MARIIDLILDRRRQNRPSEHQSNEHDGTAAAASTAPCFYSLEFFPPATEAGLDNLLTRMDRMARRLDPLFMDVTWVPSSAARSLAVASHAQKYLGVQVLLHLTTVGATLSQLRQALEQAKAVGIRNILALRGDPPRGKGSMWRVGDVSGGDCPRAVDLVRQIREWYGDYFCVGVAGHPEGHPSSTSPEQEMEHLREKMNAGADFIISQFFYDTNVFLDFCQRCRQAGLDCPIIPGILPIQSYTSFQRMTSYCQVSVPQWLSEKLEPWKSDDEKIKNIGCEIAVDMCKQILSAPVDKFGVLDGVHFYTLNLERSVTNILVSMGAVNLVQQPATLSTSASSPTTISTSNGTASSSNDTGNEDDEVSALAQNIRSTAGRALPWRPSAIDKRFESEHVRPINWANRPKSYVMRTEDWDEFPNGRWGDSTSPAFGELSNVGHFFSFSLGNEDDQRSMLGENPTEPEHVYKVFASYVEGKIPHIPWCETPLQPESFLIQSQLSRLNRAGFLTINSQPAINGVPSTDPTFGWGGRGGYVYQKAYCECFCSPENAQRLVQMMQEHDSMNLYAVNVRGEEIRHVQPGAEPGVTALTWGVFPNREIVQPTIFDPETFLVWAEEAFSLWTTMWQNLYEFDTPSYELIETIRDTFFLCAIINNDFVSENGDASIWQKMETAIN